MLVKMRIQNPNDLPIYFFSVSLQMDMQGECCGTDASDIGGRVPRFGETIIEVSVGPPRRLGL
ncbi:MAG: LEA type 2 family protein [Desulfobacteraceae bacterium]|jgi:hypothetical protein|nr:LEA type 2 family protein [Desulfobacteraceae bacterium]